MEAKTGLGAIRSMDYVILLCDDIERMKQFYRDVLALRLKMKLSEHGSDFGLGHSTWVSDLADVRMMASASLKSQPEHKLASASHLLMLI